MYKEIIVGIVCLAVGVGIGHILYHEHHDEMSDDMDMSGMEGEMDMEMSDMNMMDMHPPVEVDANEPVPTVEIETVEDSVGGINVHVMTENFTFTPETVGGDNETNTGHAHLYVNGTKVARLYSNWFHVDDKYFSEGSNEIIVTLNTNDHGTWVHQDASISDTVRINR